MKKLALSGAAVAALLVGPASAADLVARPVSRAPQVVQTAPINPLAPLFTRRQKGPIGVAGARWNGRCWVDSDSVRYYGYWGPCRTPVAARTVALTAVPIVAKN